MIPKKVFLDANILFSVAYGSPGLRQLKELSDTGVCELIASEYVIEEARRNLDSPKQQETLKRFLKGVCIVSEADPSIPCPIPLPEKDRPVFLAALISKADILVTGDITHFGPYFGKRIQKLKICTARNLIDAFSGNIS